MSLDDRLTLGDGVQNLRYTMTDIILYHIAHKHRSQSYAYHRCKQIPEVVLTMDKHLFNKQFNKTDE